MPQPTAGDVHVNAPLTQISIAYVQDAKNFISDRVFPPVRVNKQSDRYFIYNKGDWNRDEAERRGAGAESAGSGWRIDNTPTYFADVWALHKDVDDQVRANADQPLDMDRDATIFVTQKLMIKRDKQWGAKYFTTGIWGRDKTGVSSGASGTQFLRWHVANSTPIDDVTAEVIYIAEQTGYKPNKLVLGAYVYNVLRNHSTVLDRIKYTQRAVATPDIMASLFDVDEVLISMGVENTATEGATTSMSFIHGKHALLVYANPTPSIMMPSGGYTFSWTGLFGAGPTGNRIKRFRVEVRASDRVEGEMAFDMKAVATDCGVFFSGAVV